MNKANRVYFGTTWFTLPFRAHGYWVEDATGKNVAEAATLELAMALAELLNASQQVAKSLAEMLNTKGV